MPVTYGQDGKRLVPAPIVDIKKSYKRIGDTRKVKPIFTLTLNGTILNFKGSPICDDGDADTLVFQTSGGVFDYPADSVNWDNNDGQAMLFLKQEAIRELFSNDYLPLEFIPWNASQPVRCYPRVIDIEFPQDIWYRRTDYRITLEADYIIGSSTDQAAPGEDFSTVDSGNIYNFGNTSYDLIGSYNVQDASESWNISMDTEFYGVFKIEHNLSAQGYRTADASGNMTEAWINARQWVNSRLGYDAHYAQSSVFGSVTTGQFTNYNHYRTNNIDTNNGSFASTESWLLCSGHFYEDSTADVKQSASEPYIGIGVQGTIYGVDSGTIVGTTPWTATGALNKYHAASAAWNNTVSGSLYTRAQQNIGVSLNPLPLSQTVTHSFNKGTIGYNYEFNNRPLNFVSGAISETLTVQDDNPSGLVNVIAEHVVLNRAIGSVLQPINTTTAPTRVINYEAVFAAPTYPSGNNIAYLMALKPRAQVDALIANLVPTNYAVGYLFVTTDNENWSPLTQRYTRTYGWKYQRDH